MEPKYKNGGEFMRTLEAGLEEQDAYGFAYGDVALQCFSTKCTGVQGENLIKESDREQTSMDGDWEDAAEFKDGREYLEWLDQQLPYLEIFEPDGTVHCYFFRSWNKEKYYPEMESINEEMEEDVIDEHVEDIVNEEENVWEEATKPEFKDGRQLVEWLERKLPYMEPFAPDDAVHYYFSREWSRGQFQPRLDLLVEADIEEATKENNLEETIRNEGLEETKKQEDVEKTSKEEDMEEKGVEEAYKEEGMDDIRGTELTPQNSHVEGENEEEENEDLHQYIRMMISPLVLDGFLSENKEDNNNTNISKELMNETGTSNTLLSAEEKQNSSIIHKPWSKPNPLNYKKENEKEKKNDEKKAKKERRTKTFFFSRLFRRCRGVL